MTVRHLFLSLITSLTLLSSCHKEQGCTDTSAINHSNAAEEDDGSCLYTAKVAFSYSYAAKGNFEDDDIDVIELSVDGDFIGVMSTDLSIISMGCGGSAGVHKTFELGSAEQKIFLLTIRNQSNGLIIYSAEFTAYGIHQCVGIDIAY